MNNQSHMLNYMTDSHQLLYFIHKSIVNFNYLVNSSVLFGTQRPPYRSKLLSLSLQNKIKKRKVNFVSRVKGKRKIKQKKPYMTFHLLSNHSENAIIYNLYLMHVPVKMWAIIYNIYVIAIILTIYEHIIY